MFVFAHAQIEKVFAFSRIKRPITWFHFVFFICWTPIGIPILLIRVVVMLSFLGFFHSISSVPGLKNLRAYVPYLFVTCIMPICGLFHSIHGADNKAAVHVDKTIFVCNHISNFDPLWFNCVFKEFTLLCAGDYDWFWEMMKRIGILSQDDEKGKGCIYTSYFGTAQEREEVSKPLARFAIDPFSGTKNTKAPHQSPAPKPLCSPPPIPLTPRFASPSKRTWLGTTLARS